MEIYSLSFFLLVSVGLILYYTVFSRCQWICLLGLSLLFFTASGWKGLVFLLFTALTIWLGGLQLAKLDADSAARRKAPGITKDEKKAIKAQAVRRKKCLVAAVLTSNFLVLGYFKYWSYFAELLSGAFSATAPSSLGLVMPLGISFYTFQAVGYLIDCYRGRHPAEKNYVRFLLFISFFPQLIQGPINRYGEMAPQLTARHIWNWERTKRALFLFLFGAMKKYAIANLTAPTIAAILDGNDPKLAGSMALLAILLYSLQQYADFSGGIDMVLGVAQLYGIEMMPNFRQPYFSTSLGDFWRRWHISLGSWFRDYLYIPLGGNRKGSARQLLNILLVWLATGLWHGAAWNFVLWGLLYAVLLTAEKLFLLRGLQKLHVLNHVYVLLFVTLGFVLFDASSVQDAAQSIRAMFGGGGLPLVSAESLYELRSCTVLLLLAVAGATPLAKSLCAAVQRSRAGKTALAVLEPVGLTALLAVCAAFLVDGSFNPFLYFRF